MSSHIGGHPRAPGSSPVVAVLGAGNVGCALAADLVLRGFEVRLFNRSSPRLDPIREAGGIRVTGMVEGFAPIALLTNVLEEAVNGADVVAVTVPAPALPSYAPALARATTAEQVIWLNPGQSGGALYLAAEIERTNGRRDVWASDALGSVHAPPSLDHRYLHEDVGWGLVPWIHLARAVGIPTPTMVALTALAGLMNGVDYLNEGLTLDRMGLTGMTADEIRSYAAHGQR